MKKILLLILLLLPITSYGASFRSAPALFSAGIRDQGTLTSFTIDTALNVAGKSGKTTGIVFNPDRTQTSGNLNWYVYCTASTGSPTNSEAYIYMSATTTTGGNDAQRPATTTGLLYTSSNTDMTGCGTGLWKKYSFTGASLTPGQSYFMMIKNTTATPASNSFAVLVRGAWDSYAFDRGGLYSYSTSDGFTTDPSANSSIIAPMIIEYDNGDVVGNPFTASVAHAANTNSRGVRVSFSEDVYLNGIYPFQSASTVLEDISIYDGSTQIASTTADIWNRNTGVLFMFEPVLLTGGVEYDIVTRLSSNSTTFARYTMGNSPIPSAVESVWTNFKYVDGTAGSLTLYATSTGAMTLLISDNPAISVGKAWGVIE